jgi:hypothetical protein
VLTTIQASGFLVHEFIGGVLEEHVNTGSMVPHFGQHHITINQVVQLLIAEECFFGIHGGCQKYAQTHQNGYEHQGGRFPEITFLSQHDNLAGLLSGTETPVNLWVVYIVIVSGPDFRASGHSFGILATSWLQTQNARPYRMP